MSQEEDLTISELSELDGTTDDGSEEVQKTLGLLRQLRSENRQLAQNFDNLKSIHLQLVASNQQLQQNYNALYQERVNVEKQYQQLCESWRAELEEKQRQFEQARAQILQPRDLDVLRVQLLEEVEGPFTAKCDALAREAEAAQEQFVRQRREYEALQAAHQAAELRHGAEAATLLAEHSATLQAMQERLDSSSRAAQHAQGLETQLRAAKRAEEEANVKAQGLLEEVGDLRREKEALAVDREQAAIRSERRLKQLQLEEQELAGLVESLSRKVRHLQEELADSSRAQEASHAQALALQAAAAAAQAALRDAQQQGELERRAAAEKLKAAEASWTEKLAKLNEELLQMERDLSDAVLSHAEALARAATEHDARLAATEAAAAERLRDVVAQRESLAAKLEATEAAAREWQQAALEAHASARLEVGSAKQDGEAAARQLHDALAKVAVLTAELEELRQERSSLKLMASSEPATVSKAMALEARNAQLEQQVVELRAELARLRGSYEEARRELEKRLGSQRQQWGVEREGLLAKHGEALRRLQEQAREQVKTLKSKLKAARQGAALLSSENASLKIALHEAEAELAAITRPSFPNSPGAGAAMSPGGAGGWRPGTAGSGGTRSAGLSPVRGLAAAFANVRQRQEGYLEAAA